MMRLISAHTFIFTKTPFLCRQIKAAYRLKTQNIHKFEFLSAWNHCFTVNNLSLCSYPVLNDRFLCVLVCVTVVVCDEVPDVFSHVVAANNFLVLGVQKLSSCHLFFLDMLTALHSAELCSMWTVILLCSGTPTGPKFFNYPHSVWQLTKWHLKQLVSRGNKVKL